MLLITVNIRQANRSGSEVCKQILDFVHSKELILLLFSAKSVIIHVSSTL